MKTNAKHMILVNALGDLSFPYPTTAQLVAITAFVQEHVARNKAESGDLFFGRLDLLYGVKIQAPSLHIGYS